MVKEVSISDLGGVANVLFDQKTPSFDYDLPRFINEALFNTVLGVYNNNELMGIAIIRNDGDNYDIPAFVIAKAAHRRGFGKRLMTGLLKRFKDKPITLQVHPDNIAARMLYRSLGFIETDEITHAYPDGVYCINCKKELDK